ncbi:hypothetical protein Sdia_24140 [Streptomyces diastaticus subsp. diastaticus]|uniref:Uncharacterized protein n=1 Tax=Streptomyces diastaticus subsp. diastaticus TaxID=68040 RepID=A0ABQ1CMM9_STRDI|nr:hypothetical protein [Streptomyces diastaticus]GFH71646.1 hypothetical protein Sdia_24140 [Streptomyces diastaticus subsp. diastaticus]GGU13750.1 hypothetical protein GCM10015534_15690 [Streptomyces diastaticus subsp. diastaticus]
MTYSDVVAHARALSALDPDWTPPVQIPPGRTLDLTEARRRAHPVGSSKLDEPNPRHRVLNVGAVRAQREAEEAARRPPLAPASSLRFVASGSWRWCHVHPRLPDARGWTRLAAALVSAGPLLSLRVDQGPALGHGGHTRFQGGDGGAVWASVAVDPEVCGTPHRTARVIAHELAHVADELATLATVTASAWWASFSDPHRTAAAEAFAVEAEEWLTPRTTAAELLDAARRHQAGRRG